MNGRLLKYSRVAVSAGFFAAVNILVLAGSMTFPRLAVAVAGMQLLPAALAFAITSFVSWLLLTLLLGRVYCSFFCPLGFFQDIFSRLARLRPRWRMRRMYHYRTAMTKTRWFFLAVLVVSLPLGIAIVPSLLDPYTIYTRFCAAWVQPALGWIESLTAPVPVRIFKVGLLGMAVSGVSVIAVAAVAWRHGRLYCNSVCPVGSLLGLVSRNSLMRIDINTDKCVHCRECEHVCKSSCIDIQSHTVDLSRCVVCFNCLTVCGNSAISYTIHRHQLSLPMLQRVPQAGGAATAASASAPAAGKAVHRLDRRKFLTLGVIAAAAPALNAVDKATRGAASAAGRQMESGRVPVDCLAPVAPPGAPSLKQFLDNCTGCQLCVVHCPTGVIRPSVREWGILHTLHPVLDFEKGACLLSCTRCTELCPTGALRPLTVAERFTTRMGEASVTAANCIHCGSCARRCPAGAITMGRDRVPIVDTSRCVGCGECQHICPARPYKAINVNGTR